MADWEDVRRLALGLPETTERDRDGQLQWLVRDKLVAWERPLRKSDLMALGPAAPDGPILATRVEHVGVKDALIANDPEVYFTTPHFNGYPAILVRLERISVPDLEDLIVDAWLARAPTRLARFESAVESVVNGDLGELERLLAEHPRLVHERSALAHRATLLHYIAANGVEDRRQKTPANAVAIARLLLEAGAEADALADMYDGQYPTLSMLVSSAHPARAGLQVALLDTLVDHGAAVEGRGSGLWVSPLMTALAFGYLDAAQALVRRGARVDNLAAASGLGLLDEARRMLPSADALTRHRALALAAQHGRTTILALLLDADEDPNRYNPEGNHAHSTPLHQAVWSNHLDTVRLLVERGARLDLRDTIHHGTPLGWAEFGHRTQIAAYLRGLPGQG
jgi:ankyrin repeat protein